MPTASKPGQTSTMRRLLDFLYDSAAALAALFMVGLLGMVLLSIASRQFGWRRGFCRSSCSRRVSWRWRTPSSGANTFASRCCWAP